MLCERLVETLEISNLSRNPTPDLCSICVGKGTRFAYAYHRRSGVRVYLYGIRESDESVLRKLAGGGVKIGRRKSMGTPWAKITPFFLEIDSVAEVAAAIPLMRLASSRVASGKPDKGNHFHWPSELAARELVEGARTVVQVSRIERDQTARNQCIEIFGSACVVCGFDFAAVYAELGRGFIHVHHLFPLAAAKGRRKVNPETDLCPVCPNCHEMLHRHEPLLSPAELREIIAAAQSSGKITARE